MSALERQLERFRKEQFQSLSTKPAEAKRAKEERKKAKAAEAAAYATVGTDVIAAVPFKPRVGPPVMFLVKKALDCLMEARCPLSGAELLSRCGVDVSSDAELATLLASNPKVTFAGGSYSYASSFAVASKAQLAQLIAKRPEGTSLRELADAYPAVGDDAAALVGEGAAWCVENAETRDRVFYPRDAGYELPIEPALKRIWARMELPTSADALGKELAKAGIVPSARGAAPRRTHLGDGDKKKKRKRDFSKLHVTNVHLWEELFAPGAAAQFGEED